MKTLNAPVGLDPDQEAELFELDDIDTTDSALVLMTSAEFKNYLHQIAHAVFLWCTNKDSALSPIKVNNQEYYRLSEVLEVLEQVNIKVMKKREGDREPNEELKTRNLKRRT